jgi:hypothetical protein
LQLLPFNILHGEADSDMPLTDQCVGIEPFRLEDLPSKKAVRYVGRFSVAADFRRMRAGNADVVKQGRFFNEPQIELRIIDTPGYTERLVGNNPAVCNGSIFIFVKCKCS